MKVEMNDLLDCIQDDSVELEPMNVASATRIKELTMRKVQQTQQTVTHVRGGMKRVTILAAAMGLVIALGITGYAAVSHSDFFHNVFGTGGYSQPAHTDEVLDENGNVLKVEHYPAIERVDVDQERAEELLGGYVTAVGKHVTVKDYTFTVQDLIMDENGIGSVTVQVTNPNGHNLPSNGVLDDTEVVTFGYVLEGAEGTVIGDRSYTLEEGYTPNTISYVYSFAPLKPLGMNEDIVLRFIVAEKVDEYSSNTEEGQIVLSVPERLPTAYFGAEGLKAEVSSVGMALERTERLDEEMILDRLVIDYRDGSHYVVNDIDVCNMMNAAGDEKHLLLTFNRIVEPGDIERIEVTVRGTDYVLE